MSEKIYAKSRVLKWAKKNNVNLFVTNKPEEAVKNSDCVMTDKWVSMNDKVNKNKNSLKKYQVNKSLWLWQKKIQFLCIVCLSEG